MARFNSSLWVSVCVLVLALAAWIGNNASHAPIQAQGADRVLEIERYPDEPLQLVNLKIGTQSVKDRIKQKTKDNISKWGIDSVKFNEKDDWFKRVSVTVRNTSDKPVLGLQAYLFFKPAGFPMIFSLPLTFSKELKHDPIQPGAELELSVNQGLLNHTLADLKSRGAEVTRSDVSFSLDTVIFSDELQWYRGKLLRPDSATPNKWVPIDEPIARKRNQPPARNASFVPASFKAAAPVDPAAPPLFATCKQSGGFMGFACNGDFADCIRRVDLENGNPGLLSHVPVSGLCEFLGGGISCQTSTTHSRLQTDSNCQPCPDADSDGYYSASCGGNDCNDSSAAIHPGATENCSDGIDNNCNGLFDDQDTCACPTSEQDQWMPGGGWDCTLCNDAIDNDCDGDTDSADSGCNPQLCASPVLIDVSGNGFYLTNAANGVNFDLNSDGIKEKLSWTALQGDDAWLALDRNGDGVINNGTELFGNFTPQSNPPAGTGKNGFNALVEYDGAPKGGNGDGLITQQDAIFGSLRLWQDANHNGVSEANELRTLNELGLTAIECDYRESKRRDQFGNLFRYRAKVRDTRNAKVNRWAWDVFLLHELGGQGSVAENALDAVKLRTTSSILAWLQE